MDLGKLIGFLILASLGGGFYYYYQGDIAFIDSGYKIEVISNSRWNAYITYTMEGQEKTAWMFGNNNKTYEFDYKITSVSVGWDMDTNPPKTPYIKVEIYKGKKLIFSEIVHKYDTIDWHIGIRSTG